MDTISNFKNIAVSKRSSVCDSEKASREGKMKRNFLIILFLLLGLSVLLTACHQKNFTGNRVANPDSYRLDIEQMTGTDTHTLTLKAGDVLKIRFETEQGELHLEIKAPDGTAVYTGNGKEATDFTVNISESGEYSVRVEAQGAKGKIHIRSSGTGAAEQEKTK